KRFRSVSGTTTCARDSAPLGFGELGRGLYTLGGGGGDLVDDRAELAVDVLGASAGVRFRRLQLRGQLGLLRLESGDALPERAGCGAEVLEPARRPPAGGGRRGCGGGFPFRIRRRVPAADLLRSGVGEPGRECGALVRRVGFLEVAVVV